MLMTPVKQPVLLSVTVRAEKSGTWESGARLRTQRLADVHPKTVGNLLHRVYLTKWILETVPTDQSKKSVGFKSVLREYDSSLFPDHLERILTPRETKSK